jgi:hypothetical protein
MNANSEVINYVDTLTEEREHYSMYLSGQSKLNIFLHPFKTSICKYKLRKIDSIDTQLTKLISSSLKNDDYNMLVRNFINTHPLTSKKPVI